MCILCRYTAHACRIPRNACRTHRTLGFRLGYHQLGHWQNQHSQRKVQRCIACNSLSPSHCVSLVTWCGVLGGNALHSWTEVCSPSCVAFLLTPPGVRCHIWRTSFSACSGLNGFSGRHTTKYFLLLFCCSGCRFPCYLCGRMEAVPSSRSRSYRTSVACGPWGLTLVPAWITSESCGRLQTGKSFSSRAKKIEN